MFTYSEEISSLVSRSLLRWVSSEENMKDFSKALSKKYERDNEAEKKEEKWKNFQIKKKID